MAEFQDPLCHWVSDRLYVLQTCCRIQSRPFTSHTDITHVTHCLTENIVEMFSTGLELPGDHKCSLSSFTCHILISSGESGEPSHRSGSESAQSSPSAHQAAAMPAAR